jgi:glycerol-3-phosphate acyltransferase PlsY
MIEHLSFALAAYLIGSIPFGLVLTRALGYGDIRAIGSGNIGATNVLRTGNKKLALATLMLDAAKGAVAVLIARHFAGEGDALIAGFFSVLGHMFPLWLKFKGGKGVATTLGVLLALSPGVGAVCCLIWLGMAVVFRYSSLAALVAVLCAPPLAYLLTHGETFAAVCSFLALLVWIKHRANLRRLFAGEEPKIGKKKPVAVEVQGEAL